MIAQVIEPGGLFLHPRTRDSVRVPEDRFAVCCSCGAVIYSPQVRGRDAAEQLRRDHALSHATQVADARLLAFPARARSLEQAS